MRHFPRPHVARESLIRYIIPECFHCAKLSTQIPFRQSQKLPGSAALIGNVKKIRYHHIESEVLPFCGYKDLAQARRAKEVSFAYPQRSGIGDIGDTNRPTISKPRYALLGDTCCILATATVLRA